MTVCAGGFVSDSDGAAGLHVGSLGSIVRTQLRV